jgi:hypothetical protein
MLVNVLQTLETAALFNLRGILQFASVFSQGSFRVSMDTEIMLDDFKLRRKT